MLKDENQRDVLKQMRTYLALTQAQLANVVGVSPITVAKWECPTVGHKNNWRRIGETSKQGLYFYAPNHLKHYFD